MLRVLDRSTPFSRGCELMGGRRQSSEMKSGKGELEGPVVHRDELHGSLSSVKESKRTLVNWNHLETWKQEQRRWFSWFMKTWNSDGSDTIETRIYMPTNTERRAHPPRHHDSIRRERQMLSLPRRFPPLSGGYALHFANGAAPFVVKSIRQRWTREPAGHKQESVLRQQNLEAP